MVAVMAFIAVVIAILVFILIGVVAEAKPGPRRMTFVLAGKGGG